MKCMKKWKRRLSWIIKRVVIYENHVGSTSVPSIDDVSMKYRWLTAGSRKDTQTKRWMFPVEVIPCICFAHIHIQITFRYTYILHYYIYNTYLSRHILHIFIFTFLQIDTHTSIHPSNPIQSNPIQSNPIQSNPIHPCLTFHLSTLRPFFTSGETPAWHFTGKPWTQAETLRRGSLAPAECGVWRLFYRKNPCVSRSVEKQ